MPLPLAAALLASLLSMSGAEREAERLTKRSIVEYNVGDFPSALADITQAYKLDPRPALLFNLAQCHRTLEHWKQAEFFFRGYLRGKPDAANRAQVQALIREMQAKQAEADAKAEAPKPSAVAAAPAPIAAPAPPPPRPAPEAPTVLVLAAPSATPPAARRAEPKAPSPPQTLAAPPSPSPSAAPPPSAPVAQSEQSSQPHEIEARSGDAAAPAAALEGNAPPAPSHAGAYALGAIALVAAGVAAYGFLQVATFNNAVAKKQAGLTPGSYYGAQNMTYLGFGAGGAALLGLGGAILAW
ncbi:MAG: tetratricopeptide repeat protein [Deltaproteobacteria bacterium]